MLVCKNNNNNNNKVSLANVVDVTFSISHKPPIPVIIKAKIKKDSPKLKKQDKGVKTIQKSGSVSNVSKLIKYIVNDDKNTTNNDATKLHSNSLPSFAKIDDTVICGNDLESDYVNTSEIATNEIELTIALNENNLNKIKSSSSSSCK